MTQFQKQFVFWFDQLLGQTESTHRTGASVLATSRLATALGVSRPTVQRWYRGISSPHELMQDAVIDVLRALVLPNR